MAELPRGTVTFVFTDVEDSTELLKELGDAYAEVLSAHRRIVREAFRALEGIEMDTQGDAFFFVFPRARDAVAAAVQAQREHARATWPAGTTVRVRIGLHTGEPALHEEGYVGLDVVRAARICTVGRGGQILLSESTRALLGSQVPEGVSVFPLGQRHLRGLDEPERVYEISIDDVGQDEPLPEGADKAHAAPPTVVEPGSGRALDGFGARLSAAIQERVLQKLEQKLERAEPPTRAGGEAGSAVEEIAERMRTLGDEIDARVRDQLAKRGVPSDGDELAD